MMNHHAGRPKETVFDLPPLVPSRSPSRISSTHMPQPGLPGHTAEKEAEGMAGAASRLLHRAPDPGSGEEGTAA